jgi:hypothetical protein
VLRETRISDTCGLLHSEQRFIPALLHFLNGLGEIQHTILPCDVKKLRVFFLKIMH